MQETCQSISSKAAAWNGLSLPESNQCASSQHHTTSVCICLYITWKLIFCLTNILISSKQKMIFFLRGRVMFSVAFVSFTCLVVLVVLSAEQAYFVFCFKARGCYRPIVMMDSPCLSSILNSNYLFLPACVTCIRPSVYLCDQQCVHTR